MMLCLAFLEVQEINLQAVDHPQEQEHQQVVQGQLAANLGELAHQQEVLLFPLQVDLLEAHQMEGYKVAQDHSVDFHWLGQILLHQIGAQLLSVRIL